MRLITVILLLLGGAPGARAAGPDPYPGMSPEEIFCSVYQPTPAIGAPQLNTLIAILEKVDGCVMPAETPPPDFRNFKQGAARKKAFIHYWGPHAVLIQEKSGLPAAILLAQWAEESSWGASNLYVNSHNMSGHFCPARKAGEVYTYEVTFGDYSRVLSAQCGGGTSQKGSRALVFASPVDSAWAHAYNLALSPSRAATYKGIRQAVADAPKDKPADWRKLIPELDRYYAPKQGYGRKVTNHIDANGLASWEKVKVCGS